eukprot:GFUD01001669.1.p1 GENE.GFUD01001669.1~~GFUD01001669.1.p1  ORF type:complete len:173 (+),score=42.92 GFUD01001669.1:49-567(+)
MDQITVEGGTCFNGMKEEAPAKCMREVKSLTNIRVNADLRRNSSFSDMFEGDLSQNLSRSNFRHRQTFTPIETAVSIVSQVRNEKQKNTLTVEEDKPERKRRLSERILPSNWFFNKVEDKSHVMTETTESNVTADYKEKRMPKKLSLALLISNQFSASKDIKAINITVPQSQ